MYIYFRPTSKADLDVFLPIGIKNIALNYADLRYARNDLVSMHDGFDKVLIFYSGKDISTEEYIDYLSDNAGLYDLAILPDNNNGISSLNMAVKRKIKHLILPLNKFEWIEYANATGTIGYFAIRPEDEENIPLCRANGYRVHVYDGIECDYNNMITSIDDTRWTLPRSLGHFRYLNKMTKQTDDISFSKEGNTFWYYLDFNSLNTVAMMQYKDVFDKYGISTVEEAVYTKDSDFWNSIAFDIYYKPLCKHNGYYATNFR